MATTTLAERLNGRYATKAMKKVRKSEDSFVTLIK